MSSVAGGLVRSVKGIQTVKLLLAGLQGRVASEHDTVSVRISECNNDARPDLGAALVECALIRFFDECEKPNAF